MSIARALRPASIMWATQKLRSYKALLKFLSTVHVHTLPREISLCISLLIIMFLHGLIIYLVLMLFWNKVIYLEFETRSQKYAVHTSAQLHWIISLLKWMVLFLLKSKKPEPHTTKSSSQASTIISRSFATWLSVPQPYWLERIVVWW